MLKEGAEDGEVNYTTERIIVKLREVGYYAAGERPSRKRCVKSAYPGRLACNYGGYGLRRIIALLKAESWRVNHKRVERIRREERWKVPQKQPKRRRLWLNGGGCIRLGAGYPDHAWSYGFVGDRLRNGKNLRFSTSLTSMQENACRYSPQKLETSASH